MHKITVMSKPNCHLCEAALNTVQKVVGQHIPCLIEEIDITQDPDLLDKYHDDIPVILVDGVERFRHVVDPDKLAKLFYDEPGESLLGIN
jgi:glutaredoxin